MNNQTTETDFVAVAGQLTSLDNELTATDEEADDETDGRTMRRRRNRDAVIQALIDLINEGELEPTVAKIADRAGVSHRSIFRYFADLDDLAKTAVETELRNVWPHSVILDLGEGSLEHRIETFVNAQVRTFQRTHALGRVARGKMLAIPELERGLANITLFRAEQAKKQFDPELSLMTEHSADATATAITVMLSFESFDIQRRRLDMSIEQVSDTWRHIMAKMLTVAS